MRHMSLHYVVDVGLFNKHYRSLGYKRVYLPLYKVADAPFHIQGDDMYVSFREQCDYFVYKE